MNQCTCIINRELCRGSLSSTLRLTGMQSVKHTSIGYKLRSQADAVLCKYIKDYNWAEETSGMCRQLDRKSIIEC